jgi:hypothetical protein
MRERERERERGGGGGGCGGLQTNWDGRKRGKESGNAIRVNSCSAPYAT